MILTTDQLHILEYVVDNAQEWADHASTTIGENAVLDKIEKYRTVVEDADISGTYKRKSEIKTRITALYIDNGTGIQRNPDATLSDFKQVFTQQIKNAFDSELTSTGTMAITEGVIDARRTDLDNLKNLGAYLYGTNATQTQLRLADNSTITVSVTRLEEIIAQLITHGLTLYQKKWALTAAIEAATTIDEVEAVRW